MKNSEERNDVPLGEETYNDIPDYSGYCPDCEECGTTMGYNYCLSEFKCPSCGHTMDEDDWVYQDDNDSDEIPYCCRACGGPYPDCQTGCKLMDD